MPRLGGSVLELAPGERGVGVFDVGAVVLVAVELHDASADVRLECGRVLGQFGKRVDVAHRFSSCVLCSGT
jgi:hypothetical protein